MKEDVLRSMIRKQIKSNLKEISSDARSQVTQSLSRIENMAGVKMLKKALGQGGVQQQASGLLAVVKAISGDSPQVARALARMLIKKGTDMPASSETDSSPNVTEAIPAALKSRSARVDKTQAMKMMKQTLDTKPATQQADFVLDLLKGLNLKKAAKQRMFLRMRKALGEKSEE